MAMTNRSRSIVVISIISICCVSYFLLYLRLYVGHFGHLSSHQSIPPNRIVRDNANGSTVAVAATTTPTSVKSINSGQHVSTSSSRATSKGSVVLAHSTPKSNKPIHQPSNKAISTLSTSPKTFHTSKPTSQSLKATPSSPKTLQTLKATSKPTKSTPSSATTLPTSKPTKSVSSISSIQILNRTHSTATKQVNNSRPMTNHPATVLPTQDPFGGSKVILLWTRYYDEPQWKLENDFTQALPMGKSYFKSYCPQQDCYITTDKFLYNHSDAVVFHDRNILYNKDKTMPSYRFPRQRWVFYNIESPRYVYSYQKYTYQIRHAIYNWSMTYLSTSNVDARYGYIVRRIEPTRSWMFKWSIDYHAPKKYLIAWLVSHCMSQRLQFVQALEKHAKVDIYGGCGSHRCQHKSNLDCWKYEIIKYKFYLAFENSVCTDYITEKFWYPLRYGVIPVVLGGGQYRQIAPPNSYIDVSNFTSISALAKYLHKVANDKALYNSYMQWRRHWEVIIPRHWCNLCYSLHRYNSTSRHTYRTYNDDFGTNGIIKNCQNYPVPNG